MFQLPTCLNFTLPAQVGFFEKNRLRKFLVFVQDFDRNEPKTHQVGTCLNDASVIHNQSQGHNLQRMTSQELFSKFGLEKGQNETVKPI